MASHRLSITIPEDLWRQAASTSDSPSKVVHEALRALLREREVHATEEMERVASMEQALLRCGCGPLL